ncbi:MAG: methylmalonyl Co-A mutase-associated GTPase MeaB [Chromatiales bacterium]|nr:MAG: methylmalonyl Co-A mutase-associated GTPase MeaB [Chromatiales bacterium]
MARHDPEQLADALLQGDRRALARAITLVESTRPEDRKPGDRLLEKVAAHAGNSIRIGISGVPGVGKSTFIESLGNYLIDRDERLAVLAVDPSSALTGGSILGDKTRMETLSRREAAFIRPSPAGRTLGGVARHTRETMLLAEAAGFGVVLVETVGVGQSETAVAEMTDLFMLLLLPGGGDELQGIKRGIVELADLIVVNKADGDLEAAAGRAAADYRNALGFLHPRHPDWEVPVNTCSALENRGIEDVWTTIEKFRATMTANGELARARSAQALAWLWDETAEQLLETLKGDPAVRQRVAALEAAVTSGHSSPRVAAHALVEEFWKEKDAQ